MCYFFCRYRIYRLWSARIFAFIHVNPVFLVVVRQFQSDDIDVDVPVDGVLRPKSAASLLASVGFLARVIPAMPSVEDWVRFGPLLRSQSPIGPSSHIMAAFVPYGAPPAHVVAPLASSASAAAVSFASKPRLADGEVSRDDDHTTGSGSSSRPARVVPSVGVGSGPLSSDDVKTAGKNLEMEVAAHVMELEALESSIKDKLELLEEAQLVQDETTTLRLRAADELSVISTLDEEDHGLASKGTRAALLRQQYHNVMEVRAAGVEGCGRGTW